MYEIESFEVSDALVAAHGQEASNRGRLITVARELKSLSPSQLTCIIDADLDRLLDSLPGEDRLLATDHCSLEMYACTPKALSKFAEIHRAPVPGDIEGLLKAITPLLHELFLIRAANAQLRWQLRAVSWQRSANVVKGVLLFDRDDYIKRYLVKNGRWKDIEVFEQTIAELRPRLTKLDPRAFFHGRDFLEALAWYFHALKGSWRLAGEALRNALISCVEFADLRAEPMFAELERRLRLLRQ